MVIVYQLACLLALVHCIVFFDFIDMSFSWGLVLLKERLPSRARLKTHDCIQ